MIVVLEQQHHATMQMLEDLGPVLDRVVDAFGDDFPALHVLAVQHEALATELAAHYLVEERLLFPAIRALEACVRDGTTPKVPVSTPIRMRIVDHQSAAMILRRIREGRARIAADAHEDVLAVLRTFEEIDRSLGAQIHLENDVLFPEALALADALVG